jgi:LuxR family maltose regulon positive regulatory protein
MTAVLPHASDLDLIEIKLTQPEIPPRVVARTALVNRLRAWEPARVVSIVAPAGYGKTTLLCQWAARDRRPFAWVSLDAHDDDPRTLLGYVAAALDRVEPDCASVFEALRSSREPIWTAAVPRLAAALAERTDPVVLILDNVEHITSKECGEVLFGLARQLPAGSLLVLAGRSELRLPVARLRAQRLLLELGRADLALTPREGQLLLHEAGVDPSPEETLELTRKTEGWAVGLYLAALSIQDRSGTPASPSSFGGSDRFVSDYLRQEHLSHLSPKTVRFLTRSSVLHEMSAPFCDAVLERADSARELQALDRASLFLVPLDHRRDAFRYNHVFREFLLSELTREEPELVPALNRRASEWCEANNLLADAIDYADAAGDSEQMARLVGAAALPGPASSMVARSERWFSRLDDRALLERHPDVAVLGSWHHSLRGRPVEAQRWADAAERSTVDVPLADGSPSIEPWLGVLRAAQCANGAARMQADAEHALEGLAGASTWRGAALLELGAALLLQGESTKADAVFSQAAHTAHEAADAPTEMVALAERSLLAADRDDFVAAVDLAEAAHFVAEDLGLGGHARRAIELAASARAALRCGNGVRVRDDLSRAKALTPLLTHAFPWFSVQVDLELARTYLAIGDLDEGRALLDDADSILQRVPDLEIFNDLAATLRARATGRSQGGAGSGAGLTAAELRLLPHLTTYLSFREIGELLFVSRNTVKTQAISVYRKLGVSSRSEAITRAAALGLVDDLQHASAPRAPSDDQRARGVT